MINLINTYVEMQKKLDKEHGIIGVSTSSHVPTVQVYKLDKLLEISGRYGVLVSEREDSDFPFEASFTQNNIKFINLFTQGDYERIIKIEGVTHE